jgi:hypothetical protein
MPAWRLRQPGHLRQRSERSSTCCSRSTSPEVSALRHQVDKATVVGRCDCGCPSIHISVPEAVPSGALPDGVVPAELRVTPVGDEPESDVILFVRNGRLDYLEYVFYTDDPPRAWPNISRLRTFPMWP